MKADLARVGAVLTVLLATVVGPSPADAATPGGLAGTVREAGTGVPLGGVGVQVLASRTVAGPTGPVTGPVVIAGTTTASDGSYRVGGLAASRTGYWVCFTEGLLGPHLGNCFLNDGTYVGLPNPFGLTPPSTDRRVPVTAGQLARGIDANLRSAAIGPDGYGSVAGTVKQAVLGLALRNVRVSALDQAGVVLDATFSDAKGRFRLDRLLPSAKGYAICFDGSSGTGGVTLKAYGRRCYRSAAWTGGAPPVTGVVRVPVSAAVTTQGIDVSLPATI